MCTFRMVDVFFVEQRTGHRFLDWPYLNLAEIDVDAADLSRIAEEIDRHGESYVGGGAAPLLVLVGHTAND